MSGILISDVCKRFGRTVALDGVTLEIREGEFFSLLGPSGCGKTTLLNIIAGFLDATPGSVALGGQEITHLPPHRRNIGMVFQSYALFPHMSVFENVAYGLRVRKRPRPEVEQRVAEALQLVQLADYAGRMPHQLSGGQQQRVAIARALAVQPSVLLLDEPLSNLDAKLRKEMQTELRSLQQRVGITTVLVTHDQEEALALSDRVGVMGEGRLQQVGTPSEIYHLPVNRFVASFIGEATLLTADSLRQAIPTVGLPGEGLWMLRPERVRVAPTGAGGAHQMEAELLQATYVGSVYRLRFRTAGGLELAAAVPDSSFRGMPRPGQRFQLSWEPSDLVLLSNEGGGA